MSLACEKQMQKGRKVGRAAVRNVLSCEMQCVHFHEPGLDDGHFESTLRLKWVMKQGSFPEACVQNCLFWVIQEGLKSLEMGDGTWQWQWRGLLENDTSGMLLVRYGPLWGENVFFCLHWWKTKLNPSLMEGLFIPLLYTAASNLYVWLLQLWVQHTECSLYWEIMWNQFPFFVGLLGRATGSGLE